MITIYHNPRCSKSRQGLAILEESGKEFKVVKYLDTPLSEAEISEIISKLGILAEELVRKNEAVWKENYKGKQLNEGQIVSAMAQHPKLIERPIVVKGAKAVLGRPPENIHGIL
ncbi:arsenate reductase (glutaredoxin) [Marinirhabdus gelatinilytica]|uniref:Arsenate reductase n=1 Tax=Marinirhabdus gelatinilytica TaxID=1703343 RepID=A0A370QB24_9FLAO|nr:arsenate reductase (glutaredoxin) [Marinirhabdus gelatinilytica]RDK85557.1 arsenate reductase [Marinirhabdus gelatinilytica]